MHIPPTNPATDPTLPNSDNTSIIALVIANVIPLFCVIFFGWSMGEILVLYWMENVIIGGWNVLKIGCASSGGMPMQMIKIFLIPFFCFHYGFFCFVHGIFVILLASTMDAGGPDALFAGGGDPFDGFRAIFGNISYWFIPALGLMVSHGVSFIQNYWFGGEYQRMLPIIQMFTPYARIVVLHVVIIVGAFAVLFLGAPIILVALLIAGKTMLDIVMHKMSHASKAAGGQVPWLQQLVQGMIQRAQKGQR